MEPTDDVPRKGASETYNRTIKNMINAAPQAQVDKFREAARELETDDREEAFDAALKRVAKAPPAQKPEPDKRTP